MSNNHSKFRRRVFGSSLVVLIALDAAASGCSASADNDEVENELRVARLTQTAADAATPALLAATFGIDDVSGLPCKGGAPLDGVPVVFSTTLRQSGVQPSDFEIVRKDGTRVTPQCATFFPATDADEARTILLLGSFGSGTKDDLFKVNIVGSIPSADGQADFKGLSVGVVPYAQGQHLVYARRQTLSGNVGGSDQCPTQAGGKTIQQVIQLSFGSNAGNSFPTDTSYLARFNVKLSDGTVAHPIAFGDTTIDNYLELCIAQTSAATSVSIEPQTVADASGQLNGEVLSRTLEN